MRGLTRSEREIESLPDEVRKRVIDLVLGKNWIKGDYLPAFNYVRQITSTIDAHQETPVNEILWRTILHLIDSLARHQKISLDEARINIRVKPIPDKN